MQVAQAKRWYKSTQGENIFTGKRTTHLGPVKQAKKTKSKIGEFESIKFKKMFFNLDFRL